MKSNTGISISLLIVTTFEQRITLIYNILNSLTKSLSSLSTLSFSYSTSILIMFDIIILTTCLFWNSVKIFLDNFSVAHNLFFTFDKRLQKKRNKRNKLD